MQVDYIKNSKLNIADKRLISLDHVTYYKHEVLNCDFLPLKLYPKLLNISLYDKYVLGAQTTIMIYFAHQFVLLVSQI